MHKVEVIYLELGERLPEFPEEQPWIAVEASDDGRFFGSGWARKPSGESVFYVSLIEDDGNLESALAAASEWAAKYQVPKIWVDRNPL